jgi:hypothetical protein
MITGYDFMINKLLNIYFFIILLIFYENMNFILLELLLMR